jgi:hypothetical protein
MTMSSFVDGSTNFASIAFDVWTPSKKLSDELRDLIPSSHDLLNEIRRYQMPGVELMPADFTGRRLRLQSDPEREYVRDKFYVRIFLDQEAVIARDVDHVRRACFDGARFVGEHIRERVEDAIDALRPPPGACVDWFKAMASVIEMPMTVRFTGEPMHLPKHRWGDGSFACFDPLCDRIAFHMCTYFTVAPVGEAAADE